MHHTSVCCVLQLSSALYNAVNHLGPAEPPAMAPAVAEAAKTAPTSEGGRRLLQSQSQDYSLSYALAPAPGPATAADAAFAPLSADALYDAAASPDGDLYSSYKKKKKPKTASSAQTAAGSSAVGGTVTSVNGAATNAASHQLSAMSPSAAVS